MAFDHMDEFHQINDFFLMIRFYQRDNLSSQWPIFHTGIYFRDIEPFSWQWWISFSHWWISITTISLYELGQFSSLKHIFINFGILDNSRRKDIQIDAFEFLIGTRGDTRTKTPLKKRVKRMENGDFTKSGEKFLDMKNWASKCHKKWFLKFYDGKVYFLKSSTAKCRNF